MPIPRAEYNRRKANGECVICRAPARLWHGRPTIHCETHHAKQLASQHKHAETTRCKPRNSNGACLKCLTRPRDTGEDYCAQCLGLPPEIALYRKLRAQYQAEKDGAQIVAQADRYIAGTLKACQRERVRDNVLRRVIEEAFDVAQCDVRLGVEDKPALVCDEPYRRYTQYSAPVDAGRQKA